MHKLNSNNRPVFFVQGYNKHWNCFLSSFATDGKDGRYLKLQKVGPTFSKLSKNFSKSYLNAPATKRNQSFPDLIITSLFYPIYALLLLTAAGMYKLWKIRQHHWKERLKISKPTKFESDASQACEGKAPQNCEKLQTFVWWGVGVGASLCSHIVGHKRPWNFATLRSCILLVFNKSLSNWAILIN